MKHQTQRLSALLIGIPAAIIMVASTGMLVTDYVRACRRAPIDKQHIETLQEKAKQDVSLIPSLEAELEKQTNASLARVARNQVNANILIVASILFLVCGKWFISLGEQQGPRLDKIKELCLNRLPETSGSAAVGAKITPGDEGPEIDLGFVDDKIAELGRGSEAVIPILQSIQSHYHYLPDSALMRVCRSGDTR